MSITRKDIKAVLPGIEDEAMAALLSLIHGEVDAIRDELDDAKNDLTKAQNDLAAANTAKTQAETALSDYKAQQGAQATKAQKEAAFRELLKSENIGEKYTALILKATDLSGYDLGEDGKFQKASELSASIRTEYADFVTKSTTSGASVENPPAGAKTTYKSKEDILAIKDDAQRQTAIAENLNLFGY